MAEYIVVVRFFFDWPVDYPFECVVDLNDEEFDKVLMQIDKERSKLQRKRDKQQGIKRYTVEEWNAGARQFLRAIPHRETSKRPRMPGSKRRRYFPIPSGIDRVTKTCRRCL